MHLEEEDSMQDGEDVVGLDLNMELINRPLVEAQGDKTVPVKVTAEDLFNFNVSAQLR